MADKDITTIKLNKKTKERIDKLRMHKRETYDEILQSLLDILNLCRVYPEKAKIRLLNMEKLAKRIKIEDLRRKV